LAKKNLKKTKHTPWNKGLEVGQREPFSPAEVNRIKKQLAKCGDAGLRDLALFSTSIDTMLRTPDLLELTVKELRMRNRSMRNTFELPPKGRRRVGIQCTLSKSTMKILQNWIDYSDKKPTDYLFTGQIGGGARPLSIRQFNRIVKSWAESIGLDPSAYGLESLRRTRAVYILNRTGNIEAVRVLLGLTDVGKTALYLYDSTPVDALAISRAHEI